MTKYSGPEDVYRDLVEESKDNWLYGLLSFAIVEEQKIEWMKHRLDNTGTFPSATDIQGWYESLPAGALLRAKGMAEDALQTYSSEVVEELDDSFRKEIAEGIIVGEIREGRKFWPQFGVNVAGGLASSVVFAAVLVILAFLVFNDSSPVDIGAHINSGSEVKNGK